MRIVQKGKKPEKNLPLSQAGRRAVLSCHRQRRRGVLALVALGHRVAAAQSAARATSSPPWRARRSPACSPQLSRRRRAAAPGPAPCSRVAAPGPAQGAGCRVAPNSLGAGAGRLPLARSQLPPPTQRGEPARHSRRALHSRGRLQGYPRLGAGADCGHRPPRRSPPAPGVLPQ